MSVRFVDVVESVAEYCLTFELDEPPKESEERRRSRLVSPDCVEFGRLEIAYCNSYVRRQTLKLATCC